MKSSPDKQPEIKFIIEQEESQNENKNKKSYEFTAPYYTFCSYCKKFRNDHKLDPYHVQSTKNIELFKNFLDACQGKFYMITTDNFLDLLNLCNEFESDQIKTDIISHIQEKENSDIIAYYKLITDKDIVSNDYVDKIATSIAEHLNIHINDEGFLGLSDEALSKVLFNEKREPSITESKVFEIIKKRNVKKSMLYSHLNIMKLCENDISMLLKMQLDQLPDSFDTKCFWEFLKQKYEEFGGQIKEIQDLNKKLENTQKVFNDMNSKIQDGLDGYENWRSGVLVDLNNLKEANTRLNGKYNQLCDEYNDIATKYENLLKKCKVYFERTNESVDGIELYIHQSKPFQGIIYDLKQKNSKINEIIEISLPAIPDSSQNYDPYNLFEYDGNGLKQCYFHNLKQYQSNDQNWIQFKFLDKQYIFTGISIRTNYFGECYNHPKDFTILGSNDGNAWDQIFITKDDKYLNGMGKYHTYSFDKRDKSYQYIRFQQNDAHSLYKDRYGVIALSAIEFFGNDVSEMEIKL